VQIDEICALSMYRFATKVARDLLAVGDRSVAVLLVGGVVDDEVGDLLVGEGEEVPDE
jgi:hypothetical protein